MNSISLIEKHKDAIKLLRKISVKESEKADYQRQSNLKHISEKQKDLYKGQVVILNEEICNLTDYYNNNFKI